MAKKQSTDGLSGEALKAAQIYNKSLEDSNKKLKQQQSLAEGISSAFLGISGSAFFRNLTDDEYYKKLSELEEVAKGLKKEAKDASDELNSQFESMAANMNLNLESVSEITDKLSITPKHAAKLSEHFKTAGQNGLGISEIIQELGEDAGDLYEKLSGSEGVSQGFLDALDNSQKLNTELSIVNKKMNDAQELVFDFGKGLQEVGKQMTKSFSLVSIIGQLKEFDNTIKSAQVSTGINFTQNSQQMALLTSETARFGMSVQDTANLMGDLGKELRTSNFSILSQAAEDLSAMQKATGLASSDVAKLSKEFMMFGQSSKDVAKFSEETMQSAVAYGVNGKEIMEDIAGNLSKMRTMGFIGGEQSLKRMVLEAKRLGMNVDEVFESSKRARTIEGAMDMAAQLQLAGGSFASIDPMQLLSAARKGPEEMQKILGQMGSDIGSFNEKGEFKIDPIDADRLQMVSEATGQSVQSLTNMIAKNAEDVRKADLLGGLGRSLDVLSDEQKAFIMNATKIGENGKLELAADVKGVSDIGDLMSLGSKNIDLAIQAEKDKKASLEEQAQQNMSFEESKKALMNSVTNLFSVFQPVLQEITNLINFLNTAPTALKGVFAGLLAGMALLFGPAKWILNGISLSRGFQQGMAGGGFLKQLKDGFTGIFKKGGTGFAGDEAIQDKKDNTPGGSKGGLKSLAEGLKAMGDPKVFAGIGAVALAGPAMILFAPAIPVLAAFSIVGLLDKLIVRGFDALARGYGVLGNNLSNIAKGALGMAIVGASLIPFAYAASMISDTDWMGVLKGVGVISLIALGLIGIGALLGGPQVGLLLFGASMLVTVGASLLAAAYLFSQAGPMLTALSQPLNEMANMDYSGLFSFASALYTLSPAMLAFAASGLLMFNPAMLLGIGTMLGSIKILTNLMTSLGPNLDMGANGIERMAKGVIKLEEAVSKLNLEKLEKLKNIVADSGEGIGKVVAAVTQGGNNSSSGGTQKHVVELQLNGRTIQELILKDNKFVK
jgi:hypothetical protein